jgi:phosphoribosylanthranilate isomerase
MTKIKICGITNRDDALAVCDAGADAIGFVLAPEAAKRSRYVDPDTVREIVAQLPAYIVTVAVVVNEPLERIREYLGFLDRVQLHGDESPEFCAAAGPRAYKAIRPTSIAGAAEFIRWPGATLLLDAHVTGEHGGTGQYADWNAALRAVQTGKRIVLAGGLTPENVGEAIQRVRPWAVDVSGGVEESPGKKSHERIRSFVYNVRKASLA